MMWNDHHYPQQPGIEQACYGQEQWYIQPSM
jgi:hypothetical protein